MKNSWFATVVVALSRGSYQGVQALLFLNSKPHTRSFAGHQNLVGEQFQPTADVAATGVTRRETLGRFGRALTSTIFTAWTCTLLSQPAQAFENKISNKYDDRPKRRGPQPVDLGLSTRTTLNGLDDYLGLKPCGPSPNCFCSTLPPEDDPDHSIPAWIWPKTLSGPEEAMQQLKEVVLSYPPGQAGVDGGGFAIQTFDAKKGYLYVQFEALKGGYLDDVEFAIVTPPAPAPGSDRAIQVRSSSRVGYLDFGVNAKRLNWLAKALRNKGWEAEGVDFSKHPFYAMENQLS